MLVAAGVVLGSVVTVQANDNDRRIIVINNTGKRIVGLYASPIDQKDWTFNMLGSTGPIRAHDKILADIDDGTGYCRYDLKAVDAAGRTAIYMDANVCVALTWTINP
jgi:hypothetical protein